MYVIDDLLPQANWPEGHAAKIPVLIDGIEQRDEFATVRLAWASGIMIVVRRSDVDARVNGAGWSLDHG